MNSAEIQALWTAMDIDGNGSISYSEFLAATLDRNIYLQEENLWNAFRVFDRDNSGKITADELKQVLSNANVNADPEVWDEVIK
jgi:calcium-dependent protein kinase